MSVKINQDIIEQAENLGIKVTHNMKEETLLKKIEEKEASIAKKQAENKAAKAEAKKPKEKVKVIIEARDNSDGLTDQFIGFNGQSVLIQLGEEVELDVQIVDFIKTVGAIEKKFKMVPDEDGIPRKQWYDKWVSRFIVQSA